ncbi:hypothetical protein L596_009486 [Steinernema carpocapsae]|uniref:G-protein coupled receptors family 1 profile domain-containing protein n=1 Tax=Steinernema carpocapsae TaxID=34508 RepID=A0A4U5PFH4_STECR|nr:hypothetical protein L596_009486 [Steinernema carpocapsae]
MAGYHISHLAVFWISLDRFTVVSFPLMYHKMCTPNVVIYRWALTIFISTVHTSLLLVRNDLSSATPEFCRTSENWKPWCINYLFGFATLLCVANIILYLLTIRKTQSALSSQTEFQKKVYYTFFYIIIVYILFWVIPKAFYFLAKKILAKMPEFSLVSSIFLQINGIADNFMTLGNFAIYGWRHREIRVALRNMPFKKKSVRKYDLLTQPNTSRRDRQVTLVVALYGTRPTVLRHPWCLVDAAGGLLTPVVI